MENKLTLKRTIALNDLREILKKVKFRGLYNKSGISLYPYKNTKISVTTIYPQEKMGSSPVVKVKGKKETLFSPQPTIYENQLDIIKTLHKFLESEGFEINGLKEAIEYEWEGRGGFHVLPPIIEAHTYDLKNGFFDLEKLSNRFKNHFVKDATGNLHELSKRYLNSFHIDEVSKINHLDIFHSNAPLINYGLQYNGKHTFYIVCDGMHRIDYAIETLNKPIKVLLIETEKTPLIPYYAFPVPFRPTIRLSSKRSEKMYPRLERDKIHLFNDFIKKVLHYDWTEGGLNVSSLRTKTEIN